MTRDAFLGVTCHEVGHHLGGAPIVMTGLANEGQADYFATTKCLRLMFSTENNAAVLAKAQIDPFAKKICEQEHASLQDRQACERASLVASTLGKVLAGFEQKPEPKFDSPDPVVVTATSNAHPHAQCRVDTMFAGAVCAVALDVPFSRLDPREGACVEATSAVGYRPHCWYKDPVSAPAVALPIQRMSQGQRTRLRQPRIVASTPAA
jgi:hypothetical protein